MDQIGQKKLAVSCVALLLVSVTAGDVDAKSKSSSIDFNKITASHIGTDGVNTNPVSNDLCDRSSVTCTTRKGGTVTFTTTTANSDEGNLRSEMRMFVTDAVYNSSDSDGNGEPDVDAKAIQNNFVLDSYTGDDLADAGAINASVTGTLSIYKTPTSNITTNRNTYSVVFSQWHGLEEGDNKELLMLAYAEPNDSGTIDIRIDHNVVQTTSNPSKEYIEVGLEYGEKFEFFSSVDGGTLYVEVSDLDGEVLGSLTKDISESGFEETILYGKWGSYVGYDQGTDEEEGQAIVTYYSQQYSYGSVD